MTLSQFCALTGKEPETVRVWLRLGKLLGIKVGRSWEIHFDEYERYCAEGLRRPEGGIRAAQKRYYRRQQAKQSAKNFLKDFEEREGPIKEVSHRIGRIPASQADKEQDEHYDGFDDDDFNYDD